MVWGEQRFGNADRLVSLDKSRSHQAPLHLLSWFQPRRRVESPNVTSSVASLAPKLVLRSSPDPLLSKAETVRAPESPVPTEAKCWNIFPTCSCKMNWTAQVSILMVAPVQLEIWGEMTIFSANSSSHTIHTRAGSWSGYIFTEGFAIPGVKPCWKW